MKKKIIIILSVALITLTTLLFVFSIKSNETKTNEKAKSITIQNEKIEIVNDEVFIEMVLRNNDNKNIKLSNVNIFVLNADDKKVLKIKNTVNKTLKPNESVLVSSQTKANLDNNQNYSLKIEYQ